jgi:hypothetical protein
MAQASTARAMTGLSELRASNNQSAAPALGAMTRRRIGAK